MPATLEIDSTLTDRYQTTVPEPVRRALSLGKRDKIHYMIQPDGVVLITRKEPLPDTDSVLESFLGFLARDMASHPQHIQALDAKLVNRIRALVGDMTVDLDAALPDDGE
ncbi:MAG: type II toxin-antitoxin system PrlF family antitoxin [Comamonadaceae bacterium]